MKTLTGIIILISVLVSPLTTTIVEDVLYAQYDDQSRFCSQTEDKSAEFEGGEELFSQKFAGLQAKVGGHVKTLKALDIKRTGGPPPIAAVESLFSAIVNFPAVKGRIVQIDTMLGLSAEVLYCYTNDSYVTCNDRQRAFYSARDTVWSYNIGCDGWTTTFTKAEIRLDGGLVIK